MKYLSPITLPLVSILEGATTPSPAGGVGSLVYSTLVNRPMVWTGATWVTIAAALVDGGGSGGSGHTAIMSAVAPVSPKLMDTWFDTTSGIKYTYLTDGDSAQWVELGGGSGSGGSGSYTFAAEKPVSASPGDKWFDLSSGIEYTLVTDGDSSQWVELGGSGGGGTAYVSSDVPPDNPLVGTKWFDTSSGIEYTMIQDGDGFQWVEVGSGGGSGGNGTFITADDAPTLPVQNDIWVDSTTGVEYQWIVEDGQGQWVELGPVPYVVSNTIPANIVVFAPNKTLDCSKNSNFNLYLEGNMGVSFANAIDGQKITLAVTQDATGGKSLTFPPNVLRFGKDILQITLSTDPNKTDYIMLIYSGSANKFDVVDFKRGY